MATRGRMSTATAREAPLPQTAAAANYGKVALAVVVLGLGIAGAMLFRRSGPQLSPIEAEDSPLVLREESAGPRYLAEAQSPAGTAGRATATSASNATAGAPLASISPFEQDDPGPPPIDATYPREPAPDDSTLRPLAAGPTIDATAADDDRPVVRTHRIADGDDLKSLAERYLGDAARAAEIYEANRHVLIDPEVLPIGVELAIPPR